MKKILITVSVIFCGLFLAMLLSCASTQKGGAKDTSGITISVQPQGGRYGAGSDVDTLTVQASSAGGEALAYQWYSNTVKNTANGTAISGETGTSFTPDLSKAGTVYYYASLTSALGTKYSDIAALTRYDFPIEEIMFFWDDEPISLKADFKWEHPSMAYSAEDEGSPGNSRTVITGTRKATADYPVWGVNYIFPVPKDFSSLANPTDADRNDKDRATTGYIHFNIWVDDMLPVIDSGLELYAVETSDGISDHRIALMPFLQKQAAWIEVNKALSDPDFTNGYNPSGGSNKDGMGDWANVQNMRLWFYDESGQKNMMKVSDVFIYR
jgi:hypothetical protein